jgi:hypothetical protein
VGKRKPAEIMVHNRETGKLEEEKIPNYIKIAMRVMYTGSAKFGMHTSPSSRVEAAFRFHVLMVVEQQQPSTAAQ